MQQTETTLDWRFPDALALTHRHHHVRYANPDQAHLHHKLYRHHPTPPERINKLYDIHYSQIHNHYRLQAAYCSFLLSHLHCKTTPAASIDCMPSQRQHTSCTSRSSRSSRSSHSSHSSGTSRTSRNTVVPDLLLLQRPTKQQSHQSPRTQQLLQHLRARNDGCKAISVRLKPVSRLPRPQSPSMQHIGPPIDRPGHDIRAIVSSMVPPHASISSVQLLPHHSLQQVFEVKLSDMTTMLVALPPQTLKRLLRVEQNRPRSEAVVISWIRKELLQPVLPSREHQYLAHPLMRTPISPSSLPSISSVSSVSPVSSVSSASSVSPPTSPPTMPSTRVPRKFSPRPHTTRASLLKYIPLPVSLKSIPLPAMDDDRNNNNVAPPPSQPLTFNVFRPTSGTPVTSLSSPLTPAERRTVDYQAGKLIRQLSQLVPQSGNFGPALLVLSPESQIGPASSPLHANDIMLSMGCWSMAFHTILEAILRDGEDIAVQLPYPAVRRHFRRLGHLLDTVTKPSLVVVDGMDDTNLLVERLAATPDSDDGSDALPPKPIKPIKQRSASPSPSPSPNPSPSLQEVRAASSPPLDTSSSNIAVTGFRDWSHCIFGDPLFALVFCNQPSMPFLSGYHGMDHNSSEAVLDPLDPLEPHAAHAAHEETEYRAVRLLLYQCYHAIVQIVRGFYHPGRGRTTQELAARKRLNEILTKLEAVDEDPKKRFRHRRPSGEMSPAKKPRSESGDETPRR